MGNPSAGNPRERGSREYSDLGIVLRSYKLGESDKILRIFTREHGKRSAVAKGLRKTTSRFGARLEPLTCARLLMHRGRSMDTVKQAEIHTSFQEVRNDLELFAGAQAICELVDSVSVEHQPHPEVFDLLAAALELLKQYPGRAAFTRAFFEFKLMAASGFALMVDECTGCGCGTGEGEAFLSLHMGGMVCDSCRANRSRETGKLVRLSRASVVLLSWMSSHEPGQWPPETCGAAAGEIGALLDRVLEHWMEREFRTHRVMKKLPGGAQGGAGGR